MPGYTPITCPNEVAEQRGSPRSRWSAAVREFNPFAFTFITPFLIVFVIFRIYPFILGILTCFTDARVGPKPGNFIGIDNYLEVMRNSEVHHAFIVTFQYSIIVVPMSFFCGLAMAVFVNRKMRPTRFRGLCFSHPLY